MKKNSLYEDHIVTETINQPDRIGVIEQDFQELEVTFRSETIIYPNDTRPLQQNSFYSDFGLDHEGITQFDSLCPSQQEIKYSFLDVQLRK